jgi:hypothetical protein
MFRINQMATDITPFQLFGSSSSQDLDVVVFIKKIPDTILASSTLCGEFGKQLTDFLKVDKPINTNIAVVENGLLQDVYKGTLDETNNALYCTYHLHSQFFSNRVQSLLPRDTDLKILRSIRIMLSLMTKGKYRSLVKRALQGDLKEKLEVLKKIIVESNLQQELVEPKMRWVDFQKTVAFQIGQCLALIQGTELYTKEEIGAFYNDLQPYLYRIANVNNEALTYYLLLLIDKVEGRMSDMKNLYEYRYKLPAC